MDNRACYGFRPVKTRDGSAMPVTHRGFIATGYSSSQAAATVDVRIGDPVRRLNTGYFAHAAAGEDIYGIVAGVVKYYDGTTLISSSNRVPAGTTYTLDDRASEILIWPAALHTFEVDVDEAATATTYAAYLALVGENCDHIFVPTAPIGYPKLDISTHVATTAGWRIVDISPSVDNQDFSGLNVKLLVTVNETQQAPWVTAGI